MTERSSSGKTSQQRSDLFYFTAPFLVFAVFIILEAVEAGSPAVLYPVKTVVVGSLLFLFRKQYAPEIRIRPDLSAVMAGILVYIFWVGLEGRYPTLGPLDRPFDPFAHLSDTRAVIFISFRMAGAVLVVPVMEEIFWRSFGLRFLIHPDFKSVPLGTFTWFSFIFGSLAFGFEHHRWLPGVIAGAVYSILLFQKKNLFSPILAHAVTNLLLSVHVLANGQWAYW